MNKSEVKNFCIQLANEHLGWEYKANSFKNKTLKHSEVWIDTGWVLHLSAMPSVIVYNKSVNKIWGLGSKIYFKGFSRNILSSILYKSSCL